MKRKYGSTLKNESIAEQKMRERAKEAGDNSFNFGSELRKGAIGRGKHRGLADVAAHNKKSGPTYRSGSARPARTGRAH